MFSKHKSIVYLHDSHETGHLTEDKTAMPGDLQFGQNAVQQLELAG